MFATLLSKTFLLLTLSLFTAYLGSLISYKKAQNAMMNDQAQNIRGGLIAAIINIVAFLLLIYFQTKTPLNMVLMFAFTLSSGYTLGLFAFAYGDVAQKAIALTAGTTLLAGILANFGNIDFTGLGKILGIALIVFVVISIVRIFVRIKEGASRFMAGAGTLLFTGYLLYDFSRLAKVKAIAAANNWETALSFAISIYLDIINLLIQLMQLLSLSNHR